MIPQKEALELLAEVTRELARSQEADVRSVLRRCHHACALLGWQDELTKFQYERHGYPADAPVPSYRLIATEERWRPTAKFEVAFAVAAQWRGSGTFDEEPVAVTFEARWGIEKLLSLRETGSAIFTGEQKTVIGHGRDIELRRAKELHKKTFNALIVAIEDMAFDFASAAYRTLRYGDALTDLWLQYRREVETALQSLGLDQHLEAIAAGLQSDNEASWRAAVFACRNLLSDLGGHLWRDPREVYTNLPGDGQDGKLAVTPDRFVNRIAAYLHQSVVRGKGGKFIRDEAERLSNSVRSLVAYQGEAHSPIKKTDARSVALGTYFLIGELVAKTDMEPVESYQ